MFELKSETPLPHSCCERYRGIAYDGCNYYFTVRGTCKIVQITACFEQVQSFETCRVYDSMCYDLQEHCFWATAESCLSMLYKLDECFREIDCITVRTAGGCLSAITGVSYDCCENKLLVCFADGILRVNPRAPRQAETIIKARCEWFLGVLSLCPYILCYCIEDSKGSIRIYSHGGKLLGKSCVPNNFGLESAVFQPCKETCRCHFSVLRTKNGAYSYLCDYVLTCDTICDSVCPCNYELCRKRPDPKPCVDACGDVLESIALMEASLAHILNAEGEKIQKAVASTDDICKLLSVNESVNKTLSKAVLLEQLLCCKLESLSSHCNLCATDNPCK